MNVENFGALGSWKKIDEQFDPTIIQQSNDAACVSAVGEILAKHYSLNITQAEILENIGVWSNAEVLAIFLNSKETQTDVKWEGGGWNFKTPIGSLKWLVENNKIGAMLRNKSAEGHAVFVDGLDANELIIIKDPFDQTRYKMTLESFADVLSEIVWRKKR